MGAGVQSSLEALLDTSLIQQRERVENEIRVTMFETIRDYAFEQLAAQWRAKTGATASCRLLRDSLAQNARNRSARGPRRQRWDRLEVGARQRRAALAWGPTGAERGNRVAPGGGPCRLLAATRPFDRGLWLAGGCRRAACGRCVLWPLTRRYHRLRAYALDALGVHLHAFSVLRDDSQAIYEESLALFQALDDRPGRDGGARQTRHAVCAAWGVGPEGNVVFEEGLALARELGQASAIAQSLFCLGHLAYA